jgi:hypothetical protein
LIEEKIVNKKVLYFVLVCVVIAVVVVLLFVMARLGQQGPVPDLTKLSESNLTLKIAWNKQEFHIPRPAEIPLDILHSRAYRRWTSRGNVTTFTGHDGQGNTVEVQALGFVRDRSSQRHPLIPRITVHRPEGTLLNETDYNPDGIPETWTTYDQDGKTQLTKVGYRTSGKPGTPFVREVTCYRPDGTATQYVANNPDRIVWIEWELDVNGNITRKLNGGSEFDPERNSKAVGDSTNLP